MKLKLFFLAVALIFFSGIHAQNFIDQGTIEYEVKTNVKSTMGSGSFQELIKDKMQEFKVAYYMLRFAGSQSAYSFDHWADNMTQMTKNWNSNDFYNYWYYNFNNDNCQLRKNVSGTIIDVSDSILPIQWKLVPGETREIAGFNCRKAQAILFDSVYVFAFYTEEITFSGGPAGFYGLPGTILGITVPRLYTSWIATKVEVTGLDESKIKPQKAKKPISFAELTKLFNQRADDWTSSDEAEDRELKKSRDRTYWSLFL